MFSFYHSIDYLIGLNLDDPQIYSIFGCGSIGLLCTSMTIPSPWLSCSVHTCQCFTQCDHPHTAVTVQLIFIGVKIKATLLKIDVSPVKQKNLHVWFYVAGVKSSKDVEYALYAYCVLARCWLASRAWRARASQMTMYGFSWRESHSPWYRCICCFMTSLATTVMSHENAPNIEFSYVSFGVWNDGNSRNQTLTIGRLFQSCISNYSQKEKLEH